MNEVSELEVFRAILRQDLYSFVKKAFETLSPGQKFVPAGYIEAITYQLERVRRGEIKRLIINMPPRSLKSLTTSVAFPAFLLGHDPAQRIICASYSGELAYKLSNDFRTLLAAPWYRDIFPGTRVGPYKDSETEVELTARGSRLATSTGGTLTGRGGNVIIIDDPLKPVDAQSETKRTAANDWFLNTVLSRLDDKRTGAIVIVMQRVHMDDLTGFVLSQSEDWTVLCLPAIAEVAQTVPLPGGRIHTREIGDLLSPEREPQIVLDDLRRQLGSDLFYAQYQQAPVPPGGAMIKREWVQRYTEPPTDTLVIQSWDTAAKGGPDNDYSVCTTWFFPDNTHIYLMDVWRARVDYPTLKAKVMELSKKWNANSVLVEEAGTAIGLLDELKGKVHGLKGIRPERDKQVRMSIASSVFEAKEVYFPEQASWLADLEAELFSFPGSRYDDQVDSISQAINHARSSGVYKLRAWAKVGPTLPSRPHSTIYWNPFATTRW
jgi:predicted phage terminase large subunit-like protein